MEHHAGLTPRSHVSSARKQINHHHRLHANIGAHGQQIAWGYGVDRPSDTNDHALSRRFAIGLVWRSRVSAGQGNGGSTRFRSPVCRVRDNWGSWPGGLGGGSAAVSAPAGGAAWNGVRGRATVSPVTTRPLLFEAVLVLARPGGARVVLRWPGSGACRLRPGVAGWFGRGYIVLGVNGAPGW